MLVQDQAVGSSVEFFIGQRTRLVVVDLLDCICNCFPMLLSLIFGHIVFAHSVVIDHHF
jgi:hypothetical protein